MHWTETAEDSSTSRQRSEDAVAEPCPAQVTASSGAVVVVALGGATTEDALRAARDALERASGSGEDVALAVPSGSEAGEELLTTREAAVALGISVSTARRWSDEGRLRTTKTSGGHRRFRVADLRGLGRSTAPRARLRLAEPPRVTLPATGEVLSQRASLLESATRSLYEPGGAGWFARAGAEADLTRWFEALSGACACACYEAAQAATVRMARRARAAGASSLECSLFLDRISAVVARELSRWPTTAGEVKEAQRLFVVLRQAALS
jgi:excisionase family DNA binding protein